ncbi:MAG: acetoacetyl-CoA synthetase [Limisphaerales bacterium]
MAFTQLPFDHPLYILYSSGTTGKPKCIVHGQGGTLIQHRKEHQMHVDLRPEDTLFFFTTCGWMMWNWLISALATRCTIVLFDGAPTHPTPSTMFDICQQENVTVFGISAKFLSNIQKQGVKPKDSHDLQTMRMLISTGSPLTQEGFEYVYRDIKTDCHLVSMSGGTDIVSCFMLGNPNLPVYEGELQSPGLGMAVEIWNDEGEAIVGEKGELVCTLPFPSAPIGFWDDPQNTKYRDAYFSRHANIWLHGDYAEQTANGGYIIHGRSDAILNPGGVRIGTAEIYRQVEFFDQVSDAVCVGQNWQDDVRVVLFVALKTGVTLDDALTGAIKLRIRNFASPRHTPAIILQVDDIPRTMSGKIAELAVRSVIHNEPVKNTTALANPEALALYENLEALKS